MSHWRTVVIAMAGTVVPLTTLYADAHSAVVVRLDAMTLAVTAGAA